MPTRSWSEEVGESGDVHDLGPALGDDLGEAPGGGQHGQGRDEGHHSAVRDQQAVDQSAGQADEQRDEHHHGPVVAPRQRLGGQGGRPDRRQRHDRADRQVDAASGDHEGHPDRDHADHRGESQDGEAVVDARELLPRGRDAHDAEHDQRHDQAEVAPDRRAQQHSHDAAALLAAPGQGLLDLLAVGHCPSGCLAFLCHAALPSITRSRTRCSSISVAGPVCTMRPSRITRTRSTRPSTSSTSLDTTTTARPCAASERMRA